jgi:hypothetical protein
MNGSRDITGSRKESAGSRWLGSRRTQKMSARQFPESDNGYFHLTPTGWTRKDSEPPPADRLETWRYRLERPARDAKDEVTLTRVWISKNVTDAQSIALHTHHGEAVEPTRERNVVLDCHV